MIQNVPDKNSIAVGEIQTIEGVEIRCVRHCPDPSTNIVWQIVSYSPETNYDMGAGTYQEMLESVNESLWTVKNESASADGNTYSKDSLGNWGPLEVVAASDSITGKGTFAEMFASSASAWFVYGESVENGSLYTEDGSGNWSAASGSGVSNEIKSGTVAERDADTTSDLFVINDVSDLALHGKLFARVAGSWTQI